jgi:hypothetical protein
MLVLAGLAVSIAGIAVAVAALSHGTRTTSPPAKQGDVYSRLVAQLKQHIKPLVPATPPGKVVVPPAIQRQLQQNGYSCAVATSSGCSPHPCIEYAASGTVPPNGAVVSPAAATQCRSQANAVPRQIPISGP